MAVYFFWRGAGAMGLSRRFGSGFSSLCWNANKIAKNIFGIKIG